MHFRSSSNVSRDDISNEYRPIHRPRGNISAHIGPKRYSIKFYTYRIVLDKIPVSRPIYWYTDRCTSISADI